MKYCHLTKEQRYTISRLIESFTQKQIAWILSVSESTISRELKRGSVNGIYDPEAADMAAQYRRAKSKKRNKDAICEKLLNEYLPRKWSPAQIVGRLKLLKTEDNNLVCTQTLYNYIARDRNRGGDLYKKLRRKKRYRRHRTTAERMQIQHRRSITERPPDVENRRQFGHWEIDSVIGTSLESCAIVTLVERMTRFTMAFYVREKNGGEVFRKIVPGLKKLPGHVLTITSDNGCEFSLHEFIERALKCMFYFASPHHPWERGTNENTNGLLREFYPKSKSLEHVTQRELTMNVRMLNNRPRKCLGFRTPREAFWEAVATASQNENAKKVASFRKLHLQF